ncbi:MAG TPA: TonB-dependent receptor [Gemmatimonadaceae bacterium]|nr:TonB-dependent receptor [Gemmatimonadaceae bacterium]
MTRSIRLATLFLPLASAAMPSVARAQTSCRGAVSSPAAATARRWPAPLDRLITLHERGVSLRDALDRLAAAARLRLAYSADLLPLDRRVCAVYRSVAVGAALTELLEGVSVEPVVADSDRVVLAPTSTPKAAAALPAPTLTQRAGVLERVVVTGTVNGSAQRAVPVALDVIESRELQRRNARSLSDVVNGAVPGVWVWEQSPTNLLASYASIRGASSFGLSYPKVYIDGIEVANSLLVTALDVEAVDHVEVIRGPQGAALYGADAISGVVNIVTRHDGIDGGAPHAELQTGAGMAGSIYAPSGVLTQRHSLVVRAGSGVGSASLGLSASTLGDFIPDASDHRFTVSGSGRHVGRTLIVSGTTRFVAEDAASPPSPVLAGVASGDSLVTPPPGDSAVHQSVRQYTLGGTASVRQSDRWTHTAVIGVDGYSLNDASAFGTPFTAASDSALRAARGSAVRGTVRLSSVAQLGTRKGLSGAVTLALEHSAVREANRLSTTFGPESPPSEYGETERTTRSRSNTGLIGQVNGSFRDAVFLSGGVRFERSAGTTDVDRNTTLPMVGAAFVRDLGRAALKFRVAYGKGIRPAETTIRTTSWMGERGSEGAPSLAPEEQSGVEAGVDLLIGRTAGFHVTRFDQLASGLIQPVAVSSSGPGPGGGGGGSGGSGPGDGGGEPNDNDGRRIAYELQNVGEITNRGWEVSGSIGTHGLSVSTAYATVDSRVRRLADRYTGDLRPGDRMLAVPERTVSATASYARGPWSASVTGSRAFDWVNYDRLALANAVESGDRPPRDLIGEQLRSFWRLYPGVNRLRANLSYDLRRALSLVATADNLLNHQFGEPDNVTVLPGRTIAGGLRARF